MQTYIITQLKCGGSTNAYQSASFWAGQQYSYITKARASLLSSDNARSIFFTSSLSPGYRDPTAYGISFNPKNRQINYVDQSGSNKRLFFKL